MSLTYRLLRAIARFIFRLGTRYEVVGRENLPRGGPLIVAMNHIHLLDSPAAMAALPWQVTALAARKWQRHLLGILLRGAGVIFVTRGQADRRALRRALALLAAGGILGVAPEGTRSRDHRLQPARSGVAYLAHLSGAPILPVAVTGVEHVPRAWLGLRRARVRVTLGEPFRLPALDHKPRAAELFEHADLVMRRLADLLPEEYRGVYSAGGQGIKHRPVPQG